MMDEKHEQMLAAIHVAVKASTSFAQQHSPQRLLEVLRDQGYDVVKREPAP